MVDVAKIMAKWSKLKEAQRVEDASVDAQGGQEPEGGIERKGSGELQGRDVKAASKKRGQSEAGELLGKDGGSKRPRAGQQGKADKVASKSKSVGRVKQSGRKGQGAGNKSKKQSKEG